MDPAAAPDLAEIRSAATLLAGVAIPTPLQESRWLSERLGGPVLLKCENLQRTGSFKIRGAYNRIARLPADVRARGVVAASAGNHAQGVAFAASTLGVRATVFTPQGASLPKIAATRAYGADVRESGATLADALTAAHEFAAATGAELIHPYDHRDIVMGQGTVGLEIVEQCPDVRTVVVCLGGGGLLAGVAIAVQALAPAARLVGVQAAAAAAYPPSLAAGHPVSLDSVATMADGIAVPRPGDLPFSVIADRVGEVRTVSEGSLATALLLLMERAKLVVEPAGAAGVAALMDDPAAFEPPVVVVLSGGNADPMLLMRVLMQGMTAASRYMTVRLVLPDRPGSLAEVLVAIGSVGGNVVEVEHVRIEPYLALNEVEIAVTVETRGPVHSEEILQRLGERGLSVRHT